MRRFQAATKINALLTCLCRWMACGLATMPESSPRKPAAQQQAAAAAWGGLRLPRLGRRAFLFMIALGDLESVKEALASEEVAGGFVGEAQAVRRDGRAGPVQVRGGAGAEPAPGMHLSQRLAPGRPLVVYSSLACPAAEGRRWEELTPHELMTRLHSAGRCSAVVRVTPDLSDLLLGHSAW